MESSIHEKMKTAVKRYFESRGSAVKIEKRGDVLPEYVDCLVIEDSKYYGIECETSASACFDHLYKVYPMANLSKKTLPAMIGKKKVRVLLRKKGCFFQ